jgi:hypothetical protein
VAIVLLCCCFCCWVLGAAGRLLRRLQAVPINALQEGRTGSCATLLEGTDAEWCAAAAWFLQAATRHMVCAPQQQQQQQQGTISLTQISRATAAI